MNKALWNSDRGKAALPSHKKLDWRRKISDHVAYGLLTYTGLQIFVTMSALKNTTGSILPYFALIVLVAAIIPGCRLFERRWERLSDEQAADPEFAPFYRRDRLLIWLSATSLPLLLTGLFMGISYLFD